MRSLGLFLLSLSLAVGWAVSAHAGAPVNSGHGEVLFPKPLEQYLCSCRSDMRCRPSVGGFSSESYLARKPVVTLTPQNDERVVVTVHGPRTGRYFAELDELPVTQIFVAKTKVIANRR